MATLSPFGKKAAAAALVALTLGAGMAASTGEAEARGGRKGAIIAAGILGALAVGAIAANSAHASPGYYADSGYDYAPPAPVYHQPTPVYYQGGPGYYGHGYYGHRRHHRRYGYAETGYGYRGPVCTIRKQRYWDGYGWNVQRVQVCR
ncbi:MAG: hypothetical protein O9322_03450 [Beijerinckiaceae bacterium]|nr:hypothetical protein [Beijerinckiaceae bacterium]MCZ8301621.1 hypothetical protein [Beijerinckiaceae bacterium]